MTKIRVNVFDLLPMNRILRFMKLGIYHTSVVIGDQSEYYHGFALFGRTGIDSPEVIDRLPSNMSGNLYATYEIGETKYSYSECQQIVDDFKKSDRYLSDHYNFLFHNCNIFTYELCQALMADDNVPTYPMWVMRSEKIFRFIYNISVSATFSMFHKPCPGFGPLPLEDRVKSRREELDVIHPSDDASQDAVDIETADTL